MKIELRHSLLVAAALLISWLSASSVLWWFYDVGSLIRDGYFNRSQAIARVFEMGLIVAILIAAAWIWSAKVHHTRTFVIMWWNAAWKTFLLLFLYLFAVLLRREMWTQSQGVNDYAMFLPIVGRVNAVFLSEFRWISFLLQVIPSMGILSGILFVVQERIIGLGPSKSGS